MSIPRALFLAVSALSVLAYEDPAAAQSGAALAPAPAATIISADSLLRAPNTGLRIVVRDADGPDQPIGQVSILIFRSDSGAGRRPPAGIMTDDRGQATAAIPDSGDYSVVVRRVGYRAAQFNVHLRRSCEQILEVYIARSVVQFDRCQVRTAVSPPCDPNPPPTPSRGVLTTCAHAA
jgi:hypothetical protein